MIAVTKFTHGAWAVMVFVPVMVMLLVRMNHQYEREDEELGSDLVRLDANQVQRPIVVLLVESFDQKMVHALGYAKTIRAEQILAVHIEDDTLTTLELETAWESAGLKEIPLKVLRGRGDAGDRLAGFVGGLPADRDVNILVPVSHQVSRLERLSESRSGARLARALLPYEQVRLTLVRDHPEGVHPLTRGADGHARIRLTAQGTHTAVVLVDKLDRATLRAIKYALTLGANDVFAVHAAISPANAGALAEVWMAQHLPIPLDVAGVLGPQRRPGARAGHPAPVEGRERGHRRDAAAGLPEPPSADAARPDQPQDRQGARPLLACRRGDRAVLLRASPSGSAGHGGRVRREVGSPADAGDHHGLWTRGLRAVLEARRGRT